MDPLSPEAGNFPGLTRFVGEIIDQSHLYGVLSILERHDVGLVSIVPDARTAPPASTREVPS